MAEDEGHSRKNLDVAVDHVDIAVTESCTLDADENLPSTRCRRRHIFENQLVSVIVKSRSFHGSLLQVTKRRGGLVMACS